jgi:hypothetical protein
MRRKEDIIKKKRLQIAVRISFTQNGDHLLLLVNVVNGDHLLHGLHQA